MKEELLADIPNTINGVNVEFETTVNKDVKNVMINGLKHCIKPNIASGYKLKKIFISSAYDSHTLPSRHMQQKAVDISRINGKKLSIYYSQGGETKNIIDAIQTIFEEFSQRRENFGPNIKKKLGSEYPSIKNHKDHVHLSVN